MKNTQTNGGSFAAAKLQAKRRGLLAIIALVAAIGFSFISCDAGGAPRSATYTSYDDAGNEYNLVITEAAGKAAYAPTSGDTYKLTITPVVGPVKTSTGTVSSVTGVTIRLQPNGGGTAFEVTVSSTGDIVSLPTSIPVDGGGSVNTPGELNPWYVGTWLSQEIMQFDDEYPKEKVKLILTKDTAKMVHLDGHVIWSASLEIQQTNSTSGKMRLWDDKQENVVDYDRLPNGILSMAGGEFKKQ
ncbi:MAG: hypothetical protein LBQ89_08810 [Treponema sp.]|jgi:hypothetical protein|nr:hypothetical protein [Treponema sp.]